MRGHMEHPDHRIRIGSLTLVLGLFALTGCETPPVGPDTNDRVAAEGQHLAAQSNAPFELWRQGFNHGTAGWVTGDVAGPEGWCGDIEQVMRGTGDIQPSGGRAYAIVRESPCNAFHQERGFYSSGPASGLMPLNRAFPTGGYVQRLDVYLDPDWPDGTGFGYVVSFQNLDYAIPLSFRYLPLTVVKENGTLTVAGHAIDVAGWYTFHHRFYSDGGRLAVDFRLVRDGLTLVETSLSDTPSLFWNEAPASLAADNTGSGYIWFSFISGGLGLAVDEQQLRRGR